MSPPQSFKGCCWLADLYRRTCSSLVTMPNSVCVHDVIPASRQQPSKLSATYNGLEPSGGRSQIGLFPAQIRPRQILPASIVLGTNPTQKDFAFAVGQITFRSPPV